MTTAWRLASGPVFPSASLVMRTERLRPSSMSKAPKMAWNEPSTSRPLSTTKMASSGIVGLLETHAPEQVRQPEAGGEVDDDHAAEKQRAPQDRAEAAEKRLAGIAG